MIEPKQKVIDGKTFTVSPLPAMRQYKLMVRLARTLGPSFGELIGQLRNLKGASLAKLDLGTLGGAAGTLFERLDDAEAESVLNELVLETALMDGRPLKPVFNTELQGQMGTVLKLLGFALEVNYGGFFGGRGAFGIEQLQTLLSKSGTSTTSPGPSNA